MERVESARHRVFLLQCILNYDLTSSSSSFFFVRYTLWSSIYKVIKLTNACILDETACLFFAGWTTLRLNFWFRLEPCGAAANFTPWNWEKKASLKAFNTVFLSFFTNFHSVYSILNVIKSLLLHHFKVHKVNKNAVFMKLNESVGNAESVPCIYVNTKLWFICTFNTFELIKILPAAHLSRLVINNSKGVSVRSRARYLHSVYFQNRWQNHVWSIFSTTITNFAPFLRFFY